MLRNTKFTITMLLFVGLPAGSIILDALDNPVLAQASDNLPHGRSAEAIVDGNYPASYFPNTEILGAEEMRITALGTGMPNQTKVAVSITTLQFLNPPSCN